MEFVCQILALFTLAVIVGQWPLQMLDDRRSLMLRPIPIHNGDEK